MSQAEVDDALTVLNGKAIGKKTADYCPSWRKMRFFTVYAPPVHMIKLTETREITPYFWVHPHEER